MAQRVIVPPHLLNQDRSTYKLTQLAKRVAIPRDIVGTDWGPIAATCRDELGIDFDGWQDGLGQLLLSRSTPESIDQGGMLSHTVDGFNLSAMRQIGKTFFVAGSLFGLCKHYPNLLGIWTAHHMSTSDETFEAIQGFASRIRVAPHIEFVHTGSGDEEVRFWNGSRILFGARERGFGRGIPGVDFMMNDEGQIMSQRAMQNMIATLNTSWLGLHIYAGTPPKPEDNSEQWMASYDEAWTNPDPKVVVTYTDGLVWVEFGADDDADLDDVNQWIKNPSAFHRTPPQAFMRLRKKLNDDGWRREGLGLYDKDADSVFNMTTWDALKDANAPEPQRAALVLDLSPDRKWAALGIATEYSDERDLVIIRSIRGTKDVIAMIDELDKTRDLVEIAITPGAAKALETQLNKVGFEYEILTANEVSAAYGDLQEKVKNGWVAHLGQPELTFALANCKTRFLQTGESESFDRRAEKVASIDISPAVAAACALRRWGLQQSPMPVIL